MKHVKLKVLDSSLKEVLGAERVPHEEYMGKDLAKIILLIPLKIVNLENTIEDIETKLNNLNKNITELVLILKNDFITIATNN